MAALAGRQYGVVSRRQLRELGFGEGAIKRRPRLGTAPPAPSGRVYALGHRTLRAHGAWMAAVLACGAGACSAIETAAPCGSSCR